MNQFEEYYARLKQDMQEIKPRNEGCYNCNDYKYCVRLIELGWCNSWESDHQTAIYMKEETN